MSEQEAKTRLIEATQQLLDEGLDPEKITVRQIAERAQVGLGLINYHFGSKDNLLFEAVAIGMQAVVNQAYQPEESASQPAEERLRQMLKSAAEVGLRFPKLTRVGVRHDLLQGDLGTTQMVLPLLREVMGNETDEQTLRLAAFQLIASLQLAFLKFDELQLYLGMDLSDRQARARMIDLLIDNLI